MILDYLIQTIFMPFLFYWLDADRPNAHFAN